jgi:hypothetical protein
VLSLDQSQCFDRLFQDTLIAIADALGISACSIAVAVYGDLARLLFIEGQPTDTWLRNDDDGACGAPQGCPLAPLVCNLTAVAWHAVVASISPTTTTYSVLDDRLALCTDKSELVAVYRATQALDETLGPALNPRKSLRARAAPPAARARRSFPHPLDDVDSLKWLGADLLFTSRATAKAAGQRFTDFQDRCRLARCLPPSQIGAVVADASSSLWLAGGCLYTRKQLQSMVTASFQALARGTAGSNLRRSRAIAHLVGPSLHRTFPPVVTICSWVQSAWRLLLSGRGSPADITTQWNLRDGAILGASVSALNALRMLGINWSRPFELTSGPLKLNFAVPHALLSAATPSTTKTATRSPSMSRLGHALRAFCRQVVARADALRRPKDFAGLEVGLSEDPLLRAHTFVATKCAGGLCSYLGGLDAAKDFAAPSLQW